MPSVERAGAPDLPAWITCSPSWRPGGQMWGIVQDQRNTPHLAGIDSKGHRRLWITAKCGAPVSRAAHVKSNCHPERARIELCERARTKDLGVPILLRKTSLNEFQLCSGYQPITSLWDASSRTPA